MEKLSKDSFDNEQKLLLLFDHDGVSLAIFSIFGTTRLKILQSPCPSTAAKAVVFYDTFSKINQLF